MKKMSAGKIHGASPGDTKAIPIPVPLKGATISGLASRQFAAAREVVGY